MGGRGEGVAEGAGVMDGEDGGVMGLPGTRDGVGTAAAQSGGRAGGAGWVLRLGATGLARAVGRGLRMRGARTARRSAVAGVREERVVGMAGM